MENVVLIIHLILALAIILLVLIQRSEGGGLGIGGGSGGLGGLATPGGTASALTKATAFFAACFFATSLTLAIMAGAHHKSSGILETYTAETAAPAVPVGDASAEGTVTEEGAGTSTPENETASDSAVDSNASDTAVEPAQKPSVPIGE